MRVAASCSPTSVHRCPHLLDDVFQLEAGRRTYPYRGLENAVSQPASAHLLDDVLQLEVGKRTYPYRGLDNAVSQPASAHLLEDVLQLEVGVRRLMV